MKKTIYFFLVLSGILIITCTTPNKEAKEYPLQGAWELTYLKWVYPDSTYEITQFANPMVKLLTKKHWANGGQSGENKIMGGGGEYTYDGNTYTEHIKYHAQSNFVGKSVEFKSSLEGDLWKISTVTKLDSIQVEGMETWKRIIE